jgi:eukaryotic-like serine/threonine-protein kinase
MAKFTYSSGSRPLDGYVIKRGIGQGGFGEVYYALSDGGKEVALKLVRGNQDIEVRGMAQCLNLKHNNLVALYDIKTDSQGNSWIVMEYVAGECLSDLLNRNPRGLPLEQVRLIFIELARAIGHLHDNGIVHRDLKPGNIFIENGTVKVGDYGLCKFMSGSTRSPQTQSVGTVHYMAPEISTGNYGKQIDIYAVGIMLYEMITGKPPFDGETAGEVLMKHLTAMPDLSKLPPGYAEVVGKALYKDPNLRYRHIMEMVTALEADAAPIPQVLPVSPDIPPRKPPSAPSMVLPVLSAVPTTRERVQELCGSLVMSFVLAGLCTLIWAALARPSSRALTVSEVMGSFHLLVLACWAVLIPAKLWENGSFTDGWARRTAMLAMGVGVGVLVAWINPDKASFARPAEYTAMGNPSDTMDINAISPEILHYVDYACYFGIMFFALRWWTLAERQRSRRFSLLSTLWTGCVGYALAMIWYKWDRFSGQGQPSGMPYPILLALTAAIAQVTSPWSAPPPKVARKHKLCLAKGGVA